jgi:outer membrane protein assembly factor BamB
MLDLKDGKLIWSYEIGSGIIGSPAVAGGFVIIGAEDGTVYAFGA